MRVAAVDPMKTEIMVKNFWRLFIVKQLSWDGHMCKIGEAGTYGRHAFSGGKFNTVRLLCKVTKVQLLWELCWNLIWHIHMFPWQSFQSVTLRFQDVCKGLARSFIFKPLIWTKDCLWLFWSPYHSQQLPGTGLSLLCKMRQWILDSWDYFFVKQDLWITRMLVKYGLIVALVRFLW